MILTCPACATRYQADEAKFPPEGRQVRCAKCGHVWHQAGSRSRRRSRKSRSAGARAGVRSPNRPCRGPAPSRPPSTVAVRHQSRACHGRQAGAWRRAGSGLIAVVLVIGYAAVRYRQEIAMIWPQSAGVYSSLGLKVNAAWHRFRPCRVITARTRTARWCWPSPATSSIDGTRELPVPQTVRVTLSDASNHELYHWTFTPNVQTLKPGQSIPFLTRLSSPPAGARHLEVRFAPNG